MPPKQVVNQSTPGQKTRSGPGPQMPTQTAATPPIVPRPTNQVADQQPSAQRACAALPQTSGGLPPQAGQPSPPDMAEIHTQTDHPALPRRSRLFQSFGPRTGEQPRVGNAYPMSLSAAMLPPVREPDHPARSIPQALRASPAVGGPASSLAATAPQGVPPLPPQRPQAVQSGSSALGVRAGSAPQHVSPSPHPRGFAAAAPSASMHMGYQAAAEAHAARVQSRPAAPPARRRIDFTTCQQSIRAPAEPVLNQAGIQAPVIRGLHFPRVLGDRGDPSEDKPWNFFFRGELRILARIMGLEGARTHVWSPCSRERYAGELSSLFGHARFLYDVTVGSAAVLTQRGDFADRLYKYMVWKCGDRWIQLAGKAYLLLWIMQIYTDARCRYATATRESVEEVRKEEDMFRSTYQDLRAQGQFHVEMDRQCNCSGIYVAGHTVDFNQPCLLGAIDKWAASPQNRMQASNFSKAILSRTPRVMIPAGQHGRPDANDARIREDGKQEELRREYLVQEGLKREDLKQEGPTLKDPAPEDPRQDHAKRHVSSDSGDNATHEGSKRIKKE